MSEREFIQFNKQVFPVFGRSIEVILSSNGIIYRLMIAENNLILGEFYITIKDKIPDDEYQDQFNVASTTTTRDGDIIYTNHIPDEILDSIKALQSSINKTFNNI